MQYRQLGDSDLQVSTVEPRLVADLRRRRRARGSGVRAPGARRGHQPLRHRDVYGPRRGRAFLRRGARPTYPRDDYVLATKVFFPM